MLKVYKVITFSWLFFAAFNAFGMDVGVCIHPIKSKGQIYFRLDDVAAYARVGLKSIRTDLFWEAVEQERGVYNWTPYDELVQSLQKRGITPLFILAYGNKLYDNGFPPLSDEAISAFSSFAKAAALRYPGAHFEIWNEPNLDQHWSGGVSPKGYVKLARSVSKVISEVETQLSTQIKVVGPAIGGSYVDYDFLEKSFKLGLLNFIDEVSIHSYGIGNPENSRTVFDNIRQLMKKYGKVLPLSITEAGFSSLDKTESDQAKRLKEFLEISLEQNISRVMIYQWQDELVSSQYVEAHFGLLRKDGTKKSSYYVVKDFLDKSQKNLIYNLVRLVGFY